jgi:aminoglycoside phosphotransferase (APT) family kinase protein
VFESREAPQALVVASVGPAMPGGSTRRLGPVSFSRFPCDEQLPTLPLVLAESREPRVIRYRPRRRCTLRALRDGRPAFVKVFPGGEGEVLDAEARRLHAAGRAGLFDFAVPAPLAWDARCRALWHERLPGDPVIEELRSPRGPHLAERMGLALASLASSEIDARARFSVQDQLERSRRYVAALVHQAPACTEGAEELLGALRRLHRSEGEGELRPIHGSPHAHQWLRDGERLGLVDFDRYALGEPELDLATFLAELDFEDRRRCDVAGVERAFLGGYAQRGPAPNPRRIAAYRAHKHLSKALKAARAVRADGDRKAQRHLASALTLLRAEAGHPCG